MMILEIKFIFVPRTYFNQNLTIAIAADIAGYTRKCITSLLFPATKLKMILTYLNPGQNDSMELILRLKYHIINKHFC